MSSVEQEPPVGRHRAHPPRPWTVWRDPMTWAVGVVGVWLVVMTILG